MTRALRPPRIFYGWYIAGAGATTNFLIGGVTSFGFGVFITPMREELMWTTFVITIGYTIRGFEAGLMAPFTGMLVDRFGPRRMAATSVFITAAGLLIFSQSHHVPTFIASSLIVALGQSMGGFISFTAALMNWFQRKRGRAMGILTAGNGAGYLMSPILALLIEAFGWRETLVIAAVAVVAVGFPLALAIRDRPEPYGYLPDDEQPDRDPATATVAVSGGSSQTGMTVHAAVRTPAFYLLIIAIALAGPTQNVFIILNIEHMRDVGFSAGAAAAVVGVYGVVQIAIRPIGGLVADRFGRRRVYIASFLLQGVGLVLFANFDSSRFWMVPLLYPTYALGHGLYVVLFMTMIADYFGARRFATIRGIAMIPQMPFGMLWPTLAAFVFDQTGSYREIFMVYAAIATVGALSISLIRRPTWAEAQEHAEPPRAGPPPSGVVRGGVRTGDDRRG